MKFLSRFPWLLTAFAWLTFALGTVWRWFFVTRWHDPRNYVYSDMKMYVELAKRLSTPGYVPHIGDVTHPPGMTWIVEYFYQRDHSFQELVYFSFIVCALVPLAVGALGWVSFGRRAGEGCLIIASAYFTFVDFGGYFLAEIHIALVATLCVTAYLFAMKLAEGPPSPRRTVAFVATAIAGGVLFSLAMTLKMVAMPAIGGFCLLHLLFSRAPKRMLRAVVLGVFLLSALPLTGKVAARCTKANDGQFCTGSNKSASDFLLGHYGRIQAVEWHDPKTHAVMGFGSPAAYQHGYHEREVVQFGLTDQKKNNEAALKWVKTHPGQAIVLSIEHVWDCFGSYPWPANATGLWPASAASHYVFLFLMILPALILLIDVLRQRGVMGLLRSKELLIASPIFGVLLAVFLATGEVRYRIPWDGFFIVLGVEFYRRIQFRFREPAPEVASNGVAVAAADDAKNEVEKPAAQPEVQVAKEAAVQDEKEKASGDDEEAEAEVPAKPTDDEPPSSR